MSDVAKIAARPRYWTDWSEDDGDVLWWKWPIEAPPYCGSPLDLGFVVEGDTEINGSDGSYGSAKIRMHVGGWPFGDEQDNQREQLWWTPLPDAHELDRLIREEIRGGPDPFTEQSND